MSMAALTEADICRRLIKPALVEAGWDIHQQISRRHQFSLSAPGGRRSSLGISTLVPVPRRDRPSGQGFTVGKPVLLQ